MLIIIPLIQEYYYIFRKNFTRKSRSYDFEKLRQIIFLNHCENYRVSLAQLRMKQAYCYSW